MAKQKYKFEDISSSGRPKGMKARWKYFMKYKFKPFFLRNHKRNLKALISIVACFAVLLGITGYFYVDNLLNRINYKEGYTGDIDATFAVEEDETYNSMYDITDADSLNELLKSWATNGGEKMSSKNVVNVLLIGHDGDEESTRSDSMMLVSLNKKAKKIVLTSFLRDSYTYMNIAGSERYDKTNHSYAWGGVNSLIETLENNYKIVIDHYVTIDFDSFVSTIDAVGGVDVPVTEAEAKYMNRTTHFNDFKSGKSVHLDGKHALIFSRIRKLDGEAERTDRQKLVVTALIKSTKSASIGELSKLIDTVLPYITTNFSKRGLVSLATQGLAQNWMDFPIITQTEPDEDYRKGVYMRTWSYPNLFVWVVDYPLAAQKVQASIFETSNIKIDLTNHQSALDMVVDKEENTDSNNDYNNDYDEDYDQTTRWIDRDWGGEISSYFSRRTTSRTEDYDYDYSAEDEYNDYQGEEDTTQQSEEGDSPASEVLELFQ